MTKHEIDRLYFDWLYDLVCGKHYTGRLSYRKLLHCLDNIAFTYSIDTDGNREEDGISLRYRFGYENDISERAIAHYLDCRPCSVLEMMVALAKRAEEHIMNDPDIGDRTGEWFWVMLRNLGLDDMSDSRIDEGYILEVVNRFLKREYGRNGEGGLFTVRNCRHDMRSTEIWYQLMWYLTEKERRY